MSIAKTQTSESFRSSALLSFSGGLQDAYTYNVRELLAVKRSTRVRDLCVHLLRQLLKSQGKEIFRSLFRRMQS